MASRSSFRALFNLMLAVALVLPGVAAPAQAAMNELPAVGNHAAVTRHALPCDAMGMASQPMAPASHPDGRPVHHCDLYTCIGAACLPVVPSLVAAVAPVAAPSSGPDVLALSTVVDLKLRPPIA